MCREHALTAAMKLTARLPSQAPRLQAMLNKHMRCSALEVQSRSAEYSIMFKLDSTVRSQVSSARVVMCGMCSSCSRCTEPNAPMWVQHVQ